MKKILIFKFNKKIFEQVIMKRVLISLTVLLVGLCVHTKSTLTPNAVIEENLPAGKHKTFIT